MEKLLSHITYWLPQRQAMNLTELTFNQAYLQSFSKKNIENIQILTDFWLISDFYDGKRSGSAPANFKSSSTDQYFLEIVNKFFLWQNSWLQTNIPEHKAS